MTAKLAVLLKTNKDGKAFPNATNVYRTLRDHPDWRDGVLRHNELTETDEYHPTEQQQPIAGRLNQPNRITDQVLFDIRLWLERAVDWTSMPSKDLIGDAVDAVARKRLYHPVRDYLAPLARSWDGRERIATWLADYAGADGSDYTSAVGKKFLIGAVARAFTPGCKLDTMLVLVGQQGIRKSLLVRTLGRGWSTDTPFILGSKDGFESIRGSWLVEFPELAGMSGKDVEQLKAFFSSPEDRYRPPYARKTIVSPRSCAFIGTTNDRDPLKDATGARRFHCVDVDAIDIEGLEADIDQLWGEAVQRYMEGAPWWLDEREAELARQEAGRFSAVDAWEDIIREKVERSRLTRVQTSTIYEWLEIPMERQHAGTAQRLVRIMCGRLGWARPTQAFIEQGRRGRGFQCPTHTVQAEL